jgi:hypothetical protein
MNESFIVFQSFNDITLAQESYLISIFFSPIGILFGIAIASLKKTLPSGERVYTYNEKDRTHGRNIIIISSVLTIVWFYFKFLANSP